MQNSNQQIFNKDVHFDEKKNRMRHGFGAGLLMMIAAASILAFQLENVVLLNYVALVIYFLAIIMASFKFRVGVGGFATFGQIFGHAFKTVLIITLLMVLWSILSYYVFPDHVERALNVSYQEMESARMSDDDIDMAMEMARKYFLPFMVFGTIFTYLIYGVIFSLISAVFLRKEEHITYRRN